MTSPRRRPLQRDDDFERLIAHWHGYRAQLVDLGLACIETERRDAGWPNRTPEGDRKPNTGPNSEPSSLDYNDPTGDLALRYEQLTGDREAIRDHIKIASTSLAAAFALATKNIPTAAAPAVPACSVTQCEQPVEHKVTHGRTVYVDCDMIAGHWVVRPGARPTCSAHRRLRGVA